MRVYVHFNNGVADAVTGAADAVPDGDWFIVTDDDGDTLLEARLADILYIKYDYKEDLADD